MQQLALEAQDLHFRVAQAKILDGISFHTTRGEIVGLLGPNGAGKSTTMRLLTGYLLPESGRVSLGGFDLATQTKQAQRQIGYAPENPYVYPEMRVEDFLFFAARYRDLPEKAFPQRRDYVVARCGLEAVLKKRMSQLSKGYRQRVGIAQALLHDPAVLLLDEPTSGLDPEHLLEIRQLIRELREGHSVLISTHILPEVLSTCDRILVLARGRMVSSGTPQQLFSSGNLYLRVRGEGPLDLEGLPGVEGVEAAPSPPGTRAFLVRSAAAEAPELLAQRVAEAGLRLQELRPYHRELEEVFMQLVSAPPTGMPS